MLQLVVTESYEKAAAAAAEATAAAERIYRQRESLELGIVNTADRELLNQVIEIDGRYLRFQQGQLVLCRVAKL